MSIRFAAARSRPIPGLCFSTGGALPPIAANDGAAAAAVAPTRQLVLRAALRHFAEHGMAAAARARENAWAAHRRDQPAECTHWLEICRTLDRRMADAAGAAFASPPVARSHPDFTC